ncbi:MAG: hypothetical protein IJC31_05275, partial [Spirochaetaceae bacterium]|nr:hypothetical protein [Spirochaetaceae bacterium]
HYRKKGATGYFVKLDISKYFPSIDHQILYQKLRHHPFDGDTWWLLQEVVDSYGNGRGCPWATSPASALPCCISIG